MWQYRHALALRSFQCRRGVYHFTVGAEFRGLCSLGDAGHLHISQGRGSAGTGRRQLACSLT
jgi:hypothetical protein